MHHSSSLLSKRSHRVRRGCAPLSSCTSCPLPGPRIECRQHGFGGITEPRPYPKRALSQCLSPQVPRVSEPRMVSFARRGVIGLVSLRHLFPPDESKLPG